MPSQVTNLKQPNLNIEEIQNLLQAGVFLHENLMREGIIKSRWGKFWVWIRKLLWMATGYRLERLTQAITQRVLRSYTEGHVPDAALVREIFDSLKAKASHSRRSVHRMKLTGVIEGCWAQCLAATSQFVPLSPLPPIVHRPAQSPSRRSLRRPDASPTRGQGSDSPGSRSSRVTFIDDVHLSGARAEAAGVRYGSSASAGAASVESFSVPPPLPRLALGAAVSGSEPVAPYLEMAFHSRGGAHQPNDVQTVMSWDPRVGLQYPVAAASATSFHGQEFSRLSRGDEADIVVDRIQGLADGPCTLSSPRDIELRARILLSESEDLKFGVPKDRQNYFDRLMVIYNDGYRPQRNRAHLRDYVGSDDFLQHAQTVCVYYNSDQMTYEDAVVVMNRREPVNLFASTQRRDRYPYFDVATLEKMQGHVQSAYNDLRLVKKDGSSFRELPNTASVYAETLLWPVPELDSSIEIACLSIPAPALDDFKQPHIDYYRASATGFDFHLDVAKYSQEMDHLARVVVEATLDHRQKAFQGEGLGRLVITRYGQANFLKIVKDLEEHLAANLAYYQSLVQALLARKEQLGQLPIMMSEFKCDFDAQIQEYFIKPLQQAGMNVGLIHGDILENAREYDLVVNAWDPHSLPGNGNDGDHSLDGVLGSATGIGLTQSSWMNAYLRLPGHYKAIGDLEVS